MEAVPRSTTGQTVSVELHDHLRFGPVEQREDMLAEVGPENRHGERLLVIGPDVGLDAQNGEVVQHGGDLGRITVRNDDLDSVLPGRHAATEPRDRGLRPSLDVANAAELPRHVLSQD